MKLLRSVVTAALLAQAAANDSAAGPERTDRNGRVRRGGGSHRDEPDGSSLWDQRALADNGLSDHDIASLPPDHSNPVHPPTYVDPSTPQPTYYLALTFPTYQEPPIYNETPVYPDPPVYYRHTSAPTSTYPTSAPLPVYQPPAPLYHVHTAVPTYPVPTYPTLVPVKSRMMTLSPSRHYHEHVAPFAQPTYEEHAEPTYSEPKPTYSEPKPTYSEQAPRYAEPKPTYAAEPTYGEPGAPTYDEPNPTYDEPKPTYDEPRPTYTAPKPLTYDEPKPKYDEPSPTYTAPKPPTYDEPKPAYEKSKPTYDEAKPVYDSSVESYEEPVKPADYGEYDKGEVCHIKVFVDCKDGYGGPCQDVHTPKDNECARGEPIETLTFKYTNRKCKPSANSQGLEATCVDKGVFSLWDPVEVYCRIASTTKNLVVEPRSVLPGGTFSISNPGSYLPEKVDCIFRDEKGLLVQNNIIDTSGNVVLTLMDSFGAMTVYSCASVDCIETLNYEVEIDNLGDIALNIETVDFLLNEDKYHLLSDMTKRSLVPGESTIVEVNAEVDVCKVGFSYEAHVYVEAQPQYGKMCSDELRFTFNVNLPPAPTTDAPTEKVTYPPTRAPTTPSPTLPPTTSHPVGLASSAPSGTPTEAPSKAPIDLASGSPSFDPTYSPSAGPTRFGSVPPSLSPSSKPSFDPTAWPTDSPSIYLTEGPSSTPTDSPIYTPSAAPSSEPTAEPSSTPTSLPSSSPTELPSALPTSAPSVKPSKNPSFAPTARPSNPLDGFCKIETAVECTLSNGRPCDYAEKPHTLDCVGPSYVLHFSYQYCYCDESANVQGDHSVCTDLAPIVEEPVTVQCSGTSGGSYLYVSPHIVEPAQRFSVSTYDSSVLPKKIECTIFNSKGKPIQKNVIDTSGSSPLTLGDKYGAMQLDSCDEISCKEFFNYKVIVSNVASDPALITDATFFFNELSGDVAREFGTNPLNAGQSTTLDFKFDLNICSGEDYCARIIAKASPPEGTYCASENKRTVNFNPYGVGYVPRKPKPAYPNPNVAPYAAPPVPSPGAATGIIEIEGSCAIASGVFATKNPTSIDWNTQKSEVSSTRIVLRYNGKPCGSTKECYDGPGDKPKGSVAIKASDFSPPGTPYNSTVIETGDLFVIEGNPIGTKTRLMVESTDGSFIYQTLFLNTAPGGFSLTDEFGSFEVVSFTNKKQGTVSIFGTIDVTVSLSAPSLSSGETVVIATVKEDNHAPIHPGSPLDLSSRFSDMIIRPGRSVPRTITDILKGQTDLSKESSFTLILDATGKVIPGGTSADGSLRFTCFIGGKQR